MNRLLGGVIRISNTVDCAFQTYFHLNFQFGTLWRGSRRENRFDDIRCELGASTAPSSVSTGRAWGEDQRSPSPDRSTTRELVPGVRLGNPVVVVDHGLGEARGWQSASPLLSSALRLQPWFRKLDLWFQRWLPSGEKRGLRADQAATAQARAARRRPEMFHLSRHSKATHQ